MQILPGMKERHFCWFFSQDWLILTFSVTKNSEKNKEGEKVLISERYFMKKKEN